MIEELQRSVIFFSRANTTLKQQNDELTRMLLQTQGILTQMHEDSRNEVVKKEGSEFAAPVAAESANFSVIQNSESTANVSSFGSIPPMQPGATMQAMSNFQQAAAAAMQAAMQGMQSIPGINIGHLTASPAGANAQQAYTDTMTALAMQQAAMAAAAAHPYTLQSQQQHQEGYSQLPYTAFNMWPAAENSTAMHQSLNDMDGEGDADGSPEDVNAEEEEEEDLKEAADLALDSCDC
jgi:hypothetical protein